jgi:hypothetical protein
MSHAETKHSITRRRSEPITAPSGSARLELNRASHTVIDVFKCTIFLFEKKKVYNLIWNLLVLVLARMLHRRRTAN